MMKSMCLVVLFVLALISIPSESRSITHKHKRNLSFKINSTRHQNEDDCPYLLSISTACDSPKATNDQISVLFGDACDYQVGPLRIDDTSKKRFTQCWGDWIDIRGPCVSDICYVKFYRSGSDGWKLQDLYISSPYLDDAHFEFNEWIPEGFWTGQTTCPDYDPDACSGYTARSTMK